MKLVIKRLMMIRVTGKELRAEEVGLKHKDAEVRVFYISLGSICQ